MANDGEVNIGTKLDERGLDKGLRSVKKKVNNTSKDLNKGAKATNALKTAFNETGGAASSFASKMGSVASSGGAVAAGITAAILAAKKYIETLKQANEAYKVQEKAEKALSKAAKNNPYLNSESVQHLKEYASTIQSFSNYGDEGTIDIMAQLASTGRTESEIMKIMGAAADYAAAKHIDLKTAAETLNITYSGMAGTMGRQIAEIKDLTDEQLKNGDAIDLIAKKYKGLAAEAADSSTQAKNSFGDFMESVGKIANPFFESLNQRAKSFWEGMTEQMSKFNDALETASRKWGIGGIHRAVDEGVNVINTTYTNATTGEEKRGADFQNKEYLKWLKEELEWREKLTAEEQAALFEINLELKQRERLAKYEQEQAAAEAKKNEEHKRQAETLAQLKTEQDKRNSLRAAYDETLRQKQEEINQRRINGEKITKEAEAQEMYNTAFNAYIKMMSDPAFKGNSGNFKHEVDARQQIADWGEIAGKNELKEQLKEFEEELKELSDQANGVMKSQYDTLIEQLDAEYNAVIENKYLEEGEKTRIQEEYAEIRKSLEEARDEEVRKNKAAHYAELMSQAKTYTDQTVDIINSAANLMLETSKNNARAEQAELEIKYRKGEIGEEEYNKKVAESKKKAAKEQYKIQMWQWGASILQATANIAQGVSMAIAQGGVAGLITGALVGAAGAVQIASIIGSKPTPPSFSTGGIVGGTSTHGDNIAANLNSREMVMNMNQQKSLWDFINGGGNGAGGTNIVINNSASNLVTAQPKISKDKIELLIDARVNDSLKNGRYTNSLNMAQQGMSGDYYGI